METSLIPNSSPALNSTFHAWQSHLTAEVAASQITVATAKTYRQGVRNFLAWSASHPEEWNRQAVRAWLADLHGQSYKQNTIAAWFAGVRSFFAWLMQTGQIDIDPTKGLKRARRTGGASQTHSRDELTREEIGQLLASDLTPRDRALIYLLAYTGARGCELIRADVEDIATSGEDMILRIQGKGKIEKDEILVIAHADARRVLYEYLPTIPASGPLFRSESNKSKDARLSAVAMRQIVRRHLDRAGITSRRKTTHSLRHTAISNAIENGATLVEAQAMARHSDPATTQIYIHKRKRIESAAERKIDYAKQK